MFIVIDWLDGSWKGTQTKLVAERIKELWKKVLVLDYPQYGEKSAYFVEKYLNGDYGKNISARQASIFYALDRFDDSFNFKKDIEKYDYIISNRYVSANMMHHGGKIKNTEKRLEYIKWLDDLEFNILWIPRPNKVLFLDVPPEVWLKLIEKRWKEKDIHEDNTDHLNDAYDAALHILKEFSDWEKIECCTWGEILSKEEITDNIMRHFR